MDCELIARVVRVMFDKVLEFMCDRHMNLL